MHRPWFIEYKCKKEGKVFLQIDRFFPSSKTCNHCLNVVDSLPLDIRTWDCPSCGTKSIDRDINAARNCRDEGLRILSLRGVQAGRETRPDSPSSGTGETAKGGSVRRSLRSSRSLHPRERRPRRGRKSTVLDAVAHGGKPRGCVRNLRPHGGLELANQVRQPPPHLESPVQDRSASLVATADEFGSQGAVR